MSQEIFPIVNEEGEVVGSATRKECHSGSFLLHPVVHLHVFNTKGELYLQKRAENKIPHPMQSPATPEWPANHCHCTAVRLTLPPRTAAN